MIIAHLGLVQALLHSGNGGQGRLPASETAGLPRVAAKAFNRCQLCPLLPLKCSESLLLFFMEILSMKEKEIA